MSKENSFLRLENVKVHFPVRSGVFRKAMGACKAVDGVSFSLQKRGDFRFGRRIRVWQVYLGKINCPFG